MCKEASEKSDAENLTVMLKWASERDPRCTWRTGDQNAKACVFWVEQLDIACAQLAGRTDKPCRAAASAIDPDWRSPEGMYDGRASVLTLADAWAAAVAEFRRVAEAAMTEKAIG